MTPETLADIPKLTGETGFVENGAHHFGRLRAPVGLEIEQVFVFAISAAGGDEPVRAKCS